VRIGLTGPIGCGKSTVARWLGDLGAVVIDADDVARSVTEPGGPALEAVLEVFGPGVRKADGSLDRAQLGRIVFADRERLRDLERIVHPAVRERILFELEVAGAAGSELVAIEAIKLVEGGLAELCDEVWLVTCSPLVQRERLARRGLPEADATQRIAAQGDIVARLAPHATRVIDTTADAETVRSRVEAIVASLHRN
jgi:dephospho-CoA kinase